jgi:tRNA modification GTPase
MTLVLADTICAIASPPGGAARGILRLSGPEVRACLRRVLDADTTVDWEAFKAPSVFRGSLALVPPVNSRLPCDVYLWPTGRSYTGQPVAEIHTIGSRPLLEAGLRALCAAGARLAEPGEFTLRAFLAGKMDLTRAEAVLGVIDAADPGDLSVALEQLAGGFSEPLGQLRDRLLDLLAHLEVGFDFADEDLPFIAPDALDRQLAAALETVERLGRRMGSRRAASGLPRVVFVGWPNTGKSSLFNALAGRDAAIVSEHPGTTRDYLGAELDIHGRKCLLVDTAGIAADRIDEASGPEVASQAAASEQARRADVRLLCLDSSRPLNAWERGQLADETGPRVVILTKADATRRINPDVLALPTSIVTGEGIDELRERIAEAVAAARWSASAVVPGTAARCRDSLRLAAECLVRARNVLQAGLGEELVAAEIRLALDEIGRVAGTVYTEDILHRVFSRFCVGK